MPEPLPRSFYERSSLSVARELLGARLVRREGSRRLAGIILETEAYQGEEDLACHARAGLTLRTRVMYGPGGFAYVYFTYGVHWMLNAVAEPSGYPAAVLIRSIFPVEGLDQMASHRQLRLPEGMLPSQPETAHRKGWTDGPAKLTQALAITGSMNGLDLCDPQGVLWIETGESLPDSRVTTGPRVGINNVPEPWRSKAWRFLVRGDWGPGH